MYRIIGADGKEYGPISAGQLRQWISESRANAATQTLAEGASEWKPLGTFPEFAIWFNAPTLQPPVTSGQLPRRTSGYAIAGLILGMVSLTGFCCCYGFPFNVLGLIFSAVAMSETKSNPQLDGRGMALAGLILSIFSLAAGLVAWLVFGMMAMVGEISKSL